MVCYRHPGVETRLSCSECEKPICSDCAIQGPVGQKCPDCARQVGRGRVVNARPARRGGLSALPGVTRSLLLVNIGVFVAGLLPGLESAIFENGALFSARTLAGESYRLFTSAFMHGSPMHILFNMYALYILGPGLERRVGAAPFASLYVGSALAGGTLFALMNGGVAVGASGAIFGLFGAYLVMAYERRDTPLGNAQLRSIVAILAINAVFGFIAPNVAWEGHLGGFIAGVIIAGAWARLEQAPREMVLTGVVVSIAAVIGVMV